MVLIRYLILQNCIRENVVVFCRSFSNQKQTLPSYLPRIWSLNEDTLAQIEKNLILRQHTNNIPLIRSLLKGLRESVGAGGIGIQKRIQAELEKLPNKTHPRILTYGSQPCELLRVEPKKFFDQALEFSEICKRMNLFRMDHLGNYTGHKSYYLFGPLALLEQALVKYALAILKNSNFHLITVPDILPSSVIEDCGMQTEGERTQVYKLESGNCLSGTSEMALAGFFLKTIIEEKDLPVKVAAVSRCYRAETSGLHEEKGIYRVHQFTKVEMFALCTKEQSESTLEYFKDIEVMLFRNLGLNFRLLDMPPTELGTPAYQKFDIETWMPGRQMWGEISSCSNCTDYQAKRLNIRYRSADNELQFAHTVNGTAAAIPRLLIAIIESNQVGNDFISVPPLLRPYMRMSDIRKVKQIPDLKLVKHIKVS